LLKKNLQGLGIIGELRSESTIAMSTIEVELWVYHGEERRK
jgi:hypothetical protein